VRPFARTPISALTLTLCALVVTVLTGSAGVADAAGKPTTPAMTNNVATPPTGCPDHVTPPPPVDTSERPAPGQATPGPMPEPTVPIGGPRMAECGVILPQGAPAAPADINAESWVLEDLDTGAVLAAKDPHARERPASLIKLLLSLVVTRELNPNSTITATQDDANQPATRVGILPGAAYPVTDLIDALLMKSGNDVAYALATALGGLPAATQKMNALAYQLGALDTRAATPSGLDGPGMSASAYDLAVIFRAAMTNQIISTAVQTKTLTLPASNGQPAVQVTNENSLLMGDYSPRYPGEIGGKTGFTTDAQHTYADAAQQNGHRVALIMMRNPDNLPDVYKNAKELLDYGFQLDAAKLPPVGQVVDANPLSSRTTATSSAKGRTSAGATAAIRAAQAPEPFSPFGTVGKPLTILAGVALLLILVLVLRRKAAKRKRAARAKALVAEKKAADAAKARAAAEAEAAAQATATSDEPEPPPSTVGDTASWAAVDEAFAAMPKPSRPAPKRVGTGRAPAPRPTGGSADADNSTEPTEFFGRIQ
jgi:D-alanyl-D-alanine carboxypeptidase (penicillin-binding protein 5/6)